MSWVQIHRYLYVDAQPSNSVEVRIAGEIDMGSVGAARRAIDDAAAAISGEVELDMSRVTFIDGMGLGMLDDLRKELADGERELLIRMPSRATRRLMELTGMTDEYRIEMGSPSQPPELRADGIQVLDEALEGLLDSKEPTGATSSWSTPTPQRCVSLPARIRPPPTMVALFNEPIGLAYVDLLETLKIAAVWSEHGAWSGSNTAILHDLC